MRKKILGISWIIGFLLFAFLIYKIGPGRIWDNIKNLTWQKFSILFFLHFFYFFFRTLPWKIIFEKYEGNVSLGHLIIAKLAGDAINYLTPSAYLGGEPIRAMMARRTTKRKSIASVTIDKTMEILTMIFLIIIGVTIAIARISMPAHFKLILIAFVVGATLFGLFLFVKQRQGFFIWVIKVMEKIKIKSKFIERNKPKIKETDAYISEFYGHHRNTFIVVFLLYAFAFLFWTTEIFLTLVFLNAQGATFLKSFLIAILGTIVIILPTIPASFGTYEVTYVAIFVLLGLGADVGITLTLIRRIVGLGWVGIGLLVMLKRRARSEL